MLHKALPARWLKDMLTSRALPASRTSGTPDGSEPTSISESAGTVRPSCPMTLLTADFAVHLPKRQSSRRFGKRMAAMRSRSPGLSQSSAAGTSCSVCSSQHMSMVPLRPRSCRHKRSGHDGSNGLHQLVVERNRNFLVPGEIHPAVCFAIDDMSAEAAGVWSHDRVSRAFEVILRPPGSYAINVKGQAHLAVDP